MGNLQKLEHYVELQAKENMYDLEETQINQVMNMADLLEMCKFKQFWEEASKSTELTSAVQGFDDAIRKYVSHVVNITYQTIEVSTLKALLGIFDDQALKQWITKCGWKDQGNGRVFIT